MTLSPPILIPLQERTGDLLPEGRSHRPRAAPEHRHPQPVHRGAPQRRAEEGGANIREGEGQCGRLPLHLGSVLARVRGRGGVLAFAAISR